MKKVIYFVFYLFATWTPVLEWEWGHAFSLIRSYGIGRMSLELIIFSALVLIIVLNDVICWHTVAVRLAENYFDSGNCDTDQTVI